VTRVLKGADRRGPPLRSGCTKGSANRLWGFLPRTTQRRPVQRIHISPGRALCRLCGETVPTNSLSTHFAREPPRSHGRDWRPSRRQVSSPSKSRSSASTCNLHRTRGTGKTQLLEVGQGGTDSHGDASRITAVGNVYIDEPSLRHVHQIYAVKDSGLASMRLGLIGRRRRYGRPSSAH
jgi:hypothetical protein